MIGTRLATSADSTELQVATVDASIHGPTTGQRAKKFSNRTRAARVLSVVTANAIAATAPPASSGQYWRENSPNRSTITEIAGRSARGFVSSDANRGTTTANTIVTAASPAVTRIAGYTRALRASCRTCSS
jgi:hypothetical protein